MTDYDDLSIAEEELATSIEYSPGQGAPGFEDDRMMDVLSELDSEALASWNLKRIRQALGVSQQMLADRIAEANGPVKLGQSQIAKIERGERPWRVNELFAIADALNVTFDVFFSGVGVSEDKDLTLLVARLRYEEARQVVAFVRAKWSEAEAKAQELGESLLRLALRADVHDQVACNVLLTKMHEERRRPVWREYHKQLAQATASVPAEFDDEWKRAAAEIKKADAEADAQAGLLEGE